MTVYSHIFHNVEQANAFICGVNWVNDSELEPIDVLVDADESGELIVTAIVNDTDSDEDDMVIDHREHV